MRLYRIGDERHPLWDGSGAALVGGRWNSPGRPLIYASLSYGGAMLEILAHANIGRVPTTHRYVIADVPTVVPVEQRNASSLPAGWDAESTAAARRFGDQWLSELRSAILLVPSVVARLEWNALVNPAHPQATRITLSEAERVVWDRRLFSG
ncbi:RES family NAD+ phosphorylase [Zoogloea sp.]|jgi:RES domain-containing protein|uniref:RES family NAD+ phosphorylase n=1 Tax=Zoogloea sp. TaxID=49181 RepID=UPI0035B1795F